MMVRKVFLSAVSTECGSARRAIASDLRSRGLTVKEQADFRQEAEADTLLRKLHEYIEACWAVVCIVGRRSGGFPPEPAVEPFKHVLPPGMTRASYTQWELIFARHLKCRLSIYVAAATYTPDKDKAATQDEDAISQQAFVAYLKSQGLDRDSFATVDELRWKVLREDWPPVRLAKPNTLPYPSLGSLFKGRDDFLTTLRQSLRRTAADGHATAITGRALHGLGGVGKTRLAVEYAWRHESEYTALLFISGDTPQTLEANIAQLIGPLAIELPADLPQDAAVAAALDWLADNPGWFLIIDNLDTPEAALAAEKMLARLKGGHVLLTSRIGQWHQYVEPLELDVLLPADAKAYLLESTHGKRRPLPADAADAAALAGELGGLALALEQAAAYIRKRRISLADYLREWRSHKPEVQAWHDPLLMEYPCSVAVAWETTLRQLGPGEIALLRLLAFFAPDPIPLWVLEHEKAPPIWQEAAEWVSEEKGRVPPVIDGAPPSDPSSRATGKTPVPPGDWRDALAQLADFSLARWNAEEQTVTVHRVLQEIIRTRLPAGQKKAWLTTALRLLDAIRPYPSYDVRTWPKWAPLQPHVAYAVAEGDVFGIASPTTVLMNDLGQLLDARALHAQAEPLMRRALAIDEASFGPEHPNVAIRLNNLAALLKSTNRLAEAEPLMRRAIAIFGPDHLNVAAALTNLAQLLEATNHLAEAESLMWRALAIDEATFGPQHPEVATDLNNLAQLFNATNRLAEAEPLTRRVIEILETSFGPEHPNVAAGLNNLAQLLQVTNRLAEAEPLMRRTLAIDEASFGPEHPAVAGDLGNLAALLWATNRHAEAEPLMRRALIINETVFGPEHPEVATDFNNLAQLLVATNRLAEAEPLLRRALAINEASFGAQHPNFAAALNSLAALLQATNRVVEAEPLMRRAVTIDEASLGSEHPNVATDLNNLAQLLQDTNRLAEAEPLMRRAIAIFKTSFGPQHPNVAAVLNNLAQLLKAENRLAEAEPLMRRALAIDEASFGPEHPDVARDVNNLALLLQDTNRLAEAEPLMRRQLLIFVDFARRAGHEHPNSQTAIGNYAALLRAAGRSEADVQAELAEILGLDATAAS